VFYGSKKLCGVASNQKEVECLRDIKGMEEVVKGNAPITEADRLEKS